MPPMISVCIPIYNAEGFIAETVESVFRQTTTDFELIVVDDHSSDRSVEMISRYRDERLRLIVNDHNLGPEGNWNKAVQLARGSFIKVLCHDDVLYPKCLEKQAAVLSLPEHTGVVLVCCRRDIIDQQGRRLLSRSFPGRSGRWSGKRAMRTIVRRGTNLIGEPSAVLFRAEAAKKAGLFSTRFPYVIDLEFWCRLLRTGDLYCLQDSLCAFRVFQEAWSMSLFKSQRKHYIHLVESLAADRATSVTSIDLWVGRMSSAVQVILRRMFYLVWKIRNSPS